MLILENSKRDNGLQLTVDAVIISTNLGENKFSFVCKVFRCSFKIRLQFGTITAPNRGGVGISL